TPERFCSRLGSHDLSSSARRPGRGGAAVSAPLNPTARQGADERWRKHAGRLGYFGDRLPLPPLSRFHPLAALLENGFAAQRIDGRLVLFGDVSASLDRDAIRFCEEDYGLHVSDGGGLLDPTTTTMLELQ